MLKKHYQIFESLFAASDLVVISLAWIVSYYFRFSSGLFPIDKGVPPFSDYLKMIVFVWAIWAFVFRLFNLYRPMRGASRLREIWLLVKANAFSVIFLLAATYLFWEKSVPYSRLVFLIFWAVGTVSTVISRTLIRALLRNMRKRGYNLRYAIIVGAGDLSQKVMSSMLEHPEYGIELIGCLTSDEDYGKIRKKIAQNPFLMTYKTRQNQDDFALVNDLRIVGTYSDLPKFLESGKIDQVIIAMPLSDHEKLEEVINTIGDSMVDVRIVPDVHQFIKLGSQIEDFDGLPVVSLASTPLTGVNILTKRVVDFLLSVILIIVFSPLMLFLAALVKLTSRGPIFFTQERVGLDGNTFNIYKFRTMRVGAERKGAKFAVKDDPRTTVIGKYLRRFSLDELPQLFNVLRGDMSLVGPRPERPVFISEFRSRVPLYMLRHKVQAGMTGWAQVNGWRGNTSIERRIEHDLYYIEHWSLSLDLKILGLTLVNGFLNRNAY
ncbi:MAG: undecaprenyl-phosphate glucose phosphotransferase [Proteobacteria bacterium]|nr:undecaprenyl-phosphate glucose phosphotransferase [Pseudomonadota bacterium]